MPEPLQRLAFALALIGAAAAVLLGVDRHSRHVVAATASNKARIPIAVLVHSSNPQLDETRQGVLDGLAARGYRDGAEIAVSVFNPEGDLPTAGLMAQKIATGHYRLAISLSTLMLQALANANREGRVIQVFGAVTSPVAAGVGIRAMDSLDKPPFLTGIGTPQPVADLFRLMKQLNPGLRTVGVVWNPAEVNSEVCTQRARAIAAELGLRLLEAPIEQTKDVREAAESLVARGAEAFWTGGDATVNNALDSLIGVARTARIPVFSNIAGHARRGGLLDLGADYHQVGAEVGRIAAAILDGADPAMLPVRDYVPRRLLLNEAVRSGLAGHWEFPESVRARASEIIAADGSVRPGPAAAPRTAAPPWRQPWRLTRLRYVESAPADDASRGIDQGLRDAGLVSGRDYTLRDASAQGDMSILSALVASTRSDGTELLITLSTPALEAAIHQVKEIPIVFTLVANPYIAGAGTDATHHLANLTGVDTLGPYAEMIALLRRHLPDYRRLGTLYAPAEDNSVFSRGVLSRVTNEAGLSLIAVPVNSPGELADAALALAAKPIDAIVQLPDNQSSAGFTAIAQAASRARKPLLCFMEAGVEQGAAVALTMDYWRAGHDAAQKVAEILRGRAPADIPFSQPGDIRLVVSEDHARALGMVLPAALVDEADRRLPGGR